MRRRPGAIAAMILIAGAFVYLLVGGVGDNLVYFVTPSELLSRREGSLGRPMRLGGVVVDSSVRWNAERLDLRFRITDGEDEIAVRASGAPPQMFRPGIGVIVEGRLQQDGTFRATTVMVRHANEYHPPKEGEAPHEVYKTLTKAGRS